jgi:hypothetical protein
LAACRISNTATSSAEAGRGFDAAVFVARADEVASAVQRRQHVGRQLRGAFQHGGDRLGVCGREGGAEASEVRRLVEGEGQVANGGFVGHGRPLQLAWPF